MERKTMQDMYLKEIEEVERKHVQEKEKLKAEGASGSGKGKEQVAQPASNEQQSH